MIKKISHLKKNPGSSSLTSRETGGHGFRCGVVFFLDLLLLLLLIYRFIDFFSSQNV